MDATESESGSEDSLRSAIRHALNGEAILFVGAGAGSAIFGKNGSPLPMGDSLAGLLAKECGLGDGYKLDDVAEYFLESKSETALINALRRHLKVEALSSAFREIVDNPWKRIWTTNYDDAIEKALGGKAHKSVTADADVFNARGKTLLIMHINGDLSRLGQSIPKDFIISSQHYSTNTFNESVWSTVFRNDLKTAKAVIFVGYSLYDIDIARILFNPSLTIAKTHFIDREKVDPVLSLKLSRFGSVHPIGVDGFARIAEDERAMWVPPDVVEQYESWNWITPPTTIDLPTDASVYDLILSGKLRADMLLAQSNTPDTAEYCVVRNCEKPCIRHLGLSDSVSLIIGGFANGKTHTTESISLQLAASGRDVFVLDRPSEQAFSELERLCKRDGSFVLVIENYSRNLELVEHFCRFGREDCGLLLSEKTEIHELRAPALLDKITGRNLVIFELDSLEIKELERLMGLLDLRGLWGERAGLKPYQKLSYLREECRGQLHAVLIDVARSPEIRRRLAVIVDHFRSVEGGEEMLIALSLLQAIGELPRIDVAAELLQLSNDSFRKLSSDDTVRQILSVRSGVADFRSPVIASALLEGLSSAATITKVVVKCATRGEIERRADPYLGRVSVELMRFANLERILPANGKRAALQNLYEEMKTVPSIRDNALFWLQYAMARLSLGDLDLARRYFEQSYAIAKKSNFDPYQIDNHYCRLLLSEAENATDSDEAFQKVDETLRTLKRQVLRESRHYPYRSAWNLDGVSRRHGATWTVAQKSVVVGGAKYLLDAANRLDDKIARSTAVVGALQRLKSIIAELSPK